jgi:hypothetical protein
VGEDAASEIRKHLLERTGAQPTDIEQLLKDTAKAASESEIVSLQAVSTELWDLIQCGDLELKGKCVIKAPTPRARRPLERNAVGTRHAEATFGDPRAGSTETEFFSRGHFADGRGVTQVVTPDHSGHLMPAD